MARNPLTAQRGGFLGGLEPLNSLHREMNRLFDEVMGSGLPMGAPGGGTVMDARMDVAETDREIRICAEMPGVAEEDIDVSLSDDVLTIRGEKRFDKKDEKENYHFIERAYGTFQRSLRLPYRVNPEQVRATFENGVLTVTLPKTGERERTRRIQVGRGSGAQSGGTVGGQSGGHITDQAGQPMREPGGTDGQAPQRSAEGGEG